MRNKIKKKISRNANKKIDWKTTYLYFRELQNNWTFGLQNQLPHQFVLLLNGNKRYNYIPSYTQEYKTLNSNYTYIKTAPKRERVSSL